MERPDEKRQAQAPEEAKAHEGRVLMKGESLVDLPGDGQVKMRLIEACQTLGIDPEEASRFEPPSEIIATMSVALRTLSTIAIEQARRISELERAVFPQEMPD